jgi:hypothetical protein
MKKLLFTLLLTAVTASLYSQNFVNPGKQWNVRQEVNFGVTHTEIYKIGDDTLVNGIAYKIFLTTEDSITNTWGKMGLIREDSNRVYFRLYTEPEGLLYDFNLEVGESVTITNLYCYEKEMTVQNIDTVYISGVPLKRWVFNTWGSEEYWVEGIGSFIGPIQSGMYDCITDLYCKLICFFKDDTLFYKDPAEPECYFNTVGIGEMPAKDDILIKPSLVRQGDAVEISSSHAIKEIRIMNMNGVEVRHFSNLNVRSLSVSSDSLPPGIYVIMISLPSGTVSTSRLVVI